ncbi:MAG: alpha/beta fold hydrolase [Micromonosporaceae bacterium]
MGTVDIDGVTLAYDDEGSGEPLVLVHGHPFDRSMWRPQTGEFARQGWRTVVPDLRGFGDSSVVGGPLPWEVYARDIAAVLDHLGLGAVVVAGLSMGGQIALEFYRLFPDRVRAMILADTFAQLDGPERKKWRYDLADRLQREGMGGYANEVLPKMMAPYNIEKQPAVAAHVLAMMNGAPARGAAVALRSRAERPDYTGLLAEIAVPVLIVVGRDDEFTPIADAELMRRTIPDATLAVIDGAGHMPNLEQAREFNETMSRFLAPLGCAT